jgi:hypothetical protein
MLFFFFQDLYISFEDKKTVIYRPGKAGFNTEYEINLNLTY